MTPDAPAHDAFTRLLRRLEPTRALWAGPGLVLEAASWSWMTLDNPMPQDGLVASWRQHHAGVSAAQPDHAAVAGATASPLRLPPLRPRGDGLTGPFRAMLRATHA
ncbi:MAG: hypothetical protein WKF75_11530 [Singulisphaera sp.]